MQAELSDRDGGERVDLAPAERAYHV
jgi:hypothetical protein